MIKKIFQNLLISTTWGYRRYLIKTNPSIHFPINKPTKVVPNSVLDSEEQINRAVLEMDQLGLIKHQDRPKNWDTLLAISHIVNVYPKKARVFDAGGEIYSNIAPNLFLYGYSKIFVGNLVFKYKRMLGGMKYMPCDITQTKFPAGYFDVITCISVIEHGVDSEAYFREMSRILKPGGELLTSTDYYHLPIETNGLEAYGTKVKIFNEQDIAEMLLIAKKYSLVPISELQLKSSQKPVNWERFNLKFTFLLFTLRKIQ